MRLRVESIRLIGAERDFNFSPGLNIISGSIATGKTTLLRCIRGLLGTGLENFSLESKSTITSLAGQLLIGDHRYDVIRPFVTTKTALVDIAGDTETTRLPVLQSKENYPVTFGNWLLHKLELPVLEVPSAPTQPDSGLTPVTVNDYLMYCTLQQGEIDDNVFGHTDPFKNIKRKYVFDIIYGKYNIAVAQLREELRVVMLDLRRYRDQTKTFQDFLQGTPFENRAQIEKEAHTIKASLHDMESHAENRAEQSHNPSGSARLREAIRNIDGEIAKLESQLRAEKDSQEQLKRLQLQLENQSKRLTRSIVADKLLIDFDFLVCPRCGSSVSTNSTSDMTCYLCKQPMPPSQLTREDLIKEQDRLERQIDETRELVGMHGKAALGITKELELKNRERGRVAEELDYMTKSYVSDQATQIAETARRRAELRERYRTLSEFQQLFDRFDETQQRIASLEIKKESLDAEIDAAMSSLGYFEERIRFLEEQFRFILSQFKRPEFAEPGITGIDRATYLPRLDGRKFDELQSQGLKVMVNVAHAFAHQMTALKFGLKLPNILFVDGLTGNMGYEGLDQERIESIYHYLIALSQQYAEQLQIIVVDNSVPSAAKQFIKVELTEHDKLIPSHLLLKSLADRQNSNQD